jgi:hypothetical protein
MLHYPQQDTTYTDTVVHGHMRGGTFNRYPDAFIRYSSNYGLPRGFSQTEECEDSMRNQGQNKNNHFPENIPAIAQGVQLPNKQSKLYIPQPASNARHNKLLQNLNFTLNETDISTTSPQTPLIRTAIQQRRSNSRYMEQEFFHPLASIQKKQYTASHTMETRMHRNERHASNFPKPPVFRRFGTTPSNASDPLLSREKEILLGRIPFENPKILTDHATNRTVAKGSRMGHRKNTRTISPTGEKLGVDETTDKPLMIEQSSSSRRPQKDKKVRHRNLTCHRVTTGSEAT